MLDSSKNVMNVSKYTFPGILALTRCLWQWKDATSTGHISFPLVKLSIIQAPLRRIYLSKPRLTDLWLLFVQCNLLCGPWVCTLSAPTVQPRSPTMQDPKVSMCVSHANLCGRPLGSHSGALCFLMCPGRRELIPFPAPQNSPSSCPRQTENSCRVGGWEGGWGLSLSSHPDLCWRLHCRSDTCSNIHPTGHSAQFCVLWGYFTRNLISLMSLAQIFYPQCLCKRHFTSEEKIELNTFLKIILWFCLTVFYKI